MCLILILLQIKGLMQGVFGDVIGKCNPTARKIGNMKIVMSFL